MLTARKFSLFLAVFSLTLLGTAFALSPVTGRASAQEATPAHDASLSNGAITIEPSALLPYISYFPPPTATPAPEPAVPVLSSNIFRPYAGSSSFYLVGEVRNDTGTNVQSVRLDATLRDGQGNVVHSDVAYSMIDVLTPGIKSPFLVTFFDPPAWQTYQIDVSWETTTRQPYPLPLLNHTTYFDNFDAFHLVGEVRNPYFTSRDVVRAFATLYDARNEVIGVAATFAAPSPLQPGQTASFDVEVYFWLGKPDQAQIDDYLLQVFDDWQ